LLGISAKGKNFKKKAGKPSRKNFFWSYWEFFLKQKAFSIQFLSIYSKIFLKPFLTNQTTNSDFYLCKKRPLHEFLKKFIFSYFQGKPYLLRVEFAKIPLFKILFLLGKASSLRKAKIWACRKFFSNFLHQYSFKIPSS